MVIAVSNVSRVVVYLFDEDLAQSALTKGVVLQVEAVKAVEGLLTGMHVKGVHIQIIPADNWTRAAKAVF